MSLKPDYEAFLKARNQRRSAEQLGHYAPHCDSRVLHRQGACVYCSHEEFSDLHEFRQTNGISYTGESAGKWPCPAEQARSLKTINRWPGNTPKPEGCTCTMFQLDEDPCPIHK